MSCCLKLALVSTAFWLSIADKSDADQGDCLLASKSQLTRPRASMQPHEAREALNQEESRHHTWSKEHHRLFKAANVSTDSLDRFIKAQNESDQHCSARLMESKRALDGLLKDLAAITQQVESHEEVLSTESENLNITHQAIEAVESTFEDEKAECNSQIQEANEDLAILNAELEELNQIANPKVRYNHAINMSMVPAAPAASKPATALLEEGTWSQKQCHTFSKFVQHSILEVVAKAKNLTCDEQREELQKVYTETYIAVRDLIEDAQDRAHDKTCLETAQAKSTSELVPLTSQRDSAAGRIEYSTQALAMLEPILNMLTRRVEKLEKHINLTLTPECKEAAKVASTIKVVRDLIISLEKCPGRNDFRLTIPPESGTSSTAAPGLLQMNNSGLSKGAPKAQPLSQSVGSEVSAPMALAGSGHDAQLKPKFVINAKASTEEHQAVHDHSGSHHDKKKHREEQHKMAKQPRESHHGGSHDRKATTQVSEATEANSNAHIQKIVQATEAIAANTNSQSDEASNDDYDNDDDDNNHDPANNGKDEYDEFQARVETKSTPNGTVTTYTEEKVASDDTNNNESY